MSGSSKMKPGLRSNKKGSSSENEFLLTILHTGDEHSSIIPHSPAIDYHPELPNSTIGGFARLAGAVNEIRDKKDSRIEPVLLFSAGDFLGGPAFSWLTLDGHSAELSIMQEIGYNAVTIGNHEFDYGTEVLTGYLYEAGYPMAHKKTAVLGSCIAPPEDHLINNLQLKETHIIETENGLKVGLFSILGDESLMVTVDTCPFRFKNQILTAQSCVEELKKQNVDIIIALSHSSDSEDSELAKSVPGIHLIIGGHSHNSYHEPVIIKKTIIVKAGAFLNCLGILELVYNRNRNELILRNNETGTPFLETIDSRFKPDPKIVSIVEDYTDELGLLISRLTGGRFKEVMEPVAQSDFPLVHDHSSFETPMGNFLTDAMRLVVEKKKGRRVDFAFQASGVIRNKITPGSMEHSRGVISFYELTEAFGLGCGQQRRPGFPLASMYITGEEVRRILEISVLLREFMGTDYFLQVSGLRFRYDPKRAILFHIPYENLPVPTTRAVLQAERYTGKGLQTNNDDHYVPLNRGDKKLYHVVTDYAILEAIPHVADRLPWLSVEPKDREGRPLPTREDAIIYVNDNEYKVWEAVVEYAADHQTKHSVDNDKLGENEKASGLPLINHYYRQHSGRVTTVKTINLLMWPALAMGIVTGVIICRKLFTLRKLQV